MEIYGSRYVKVQADHRDRAPPRSGMLTRGAGQLPMSKFCIVLSFAS